MHFDKDTCEFQSYGSRSNFAKSKANDTWTVNESKRIPCHFSQTRKFSKVNDLQLESSITVRTDCIREHQGYVTNLQVKVLIKSRANLVTHSKAVEIKIQCSHHYGDFQKCCTQHSCRSLLVIVRLVTYTENLLMIDARELKAHKDGYHLGCGRVVFQNSRVMQEPPEERQFTLSTILV